MDDFKRVDVTSNTTKTPSTVSGNKPKTDKKKRKLIPKASTIVIVILLLALAGGGYYFYNKYSETKQEVEKLSTVQGQQELNKSQTEQLLSEMRSIIVLPTGEDPVVATITDVKQLDKNEFYKDAQNDDRVIVFAKAQKAYIYRPSTKTIVNVGAFQLDQQSQKQSTQNSNPN